MKVREQGIAAVVLAAGLSRRMGAQHKLRLPLDDGRAVLVHAVENASRWVPVRLVVVLQPEMEDLREALVGFPVEAIYNPQYASGMASSLRTGIRALGDDEEVEAALVLLGDQPRVDERVIAAIMEAYVNEGKSITVPVYGGVQGPPTLFRRGVFPELLVLAGDEGGRPVVRRDPSRVALVALPAGLMPPDIDTPEDYARYMGE